MRLPIAIATVFLGGLSAQAQESSEHPADHSHHDHHVVETRKSTDPPIKITINPEARVSVVRGGSLPPVKACGEAIELPVKITNQGFVTASLRASIVGDGGRHISVHMDGAKLSGKAEDNWTLHLIPIGPGLVDVTIAFSR